MPLKKSVDDVRERVVEIRTPQGAPQPLVTWQPTLGAVPEANGVRFRVWAPARAQVELIVDPQGSAPRRHPLAPEDDGLFTGLFGRVRPGDLYAYVLDGEGPYPDPASRFQPLGVHGPSAVVDPGTFAWSDHGWRGVPLERAVLYELHVGTFTPSGTYAGALERLPHLVDLGVTSIELMPLADFPGSRNWGYDGVSLFAPSRAYGTPDDLRRLVDEAHHLGLGVLVDVVYNHFGPDGAYSPQFSPFYLSTRHHSPWGPAVNLDGERAQRVRDFFVENALHWLHEYHVDGLRLDATHWLIDEGRPHFVAELAARVRASVAGRATLLIAEDERNLAAIVRPAEDDGWGLDAVWADDFHHQARVLSAGDRDGYYRDFSGTMADLATTLRRGWFYCGQHASYAGGPRGTDPEGVPLERMVICLQNHDQIGNRPFGRRLNHQIEPALFRALSALLLFAPETPLLFMGQEWAASTPFLYFTDHHAELGRLVTQGRREEFSRFEAFADPTTRALIPDPQAASTFEASRLRWNERTHAPHAGVLALYRALLRLRRDEPSLRAGTPFDVAAIDDAGLAAVRGSDGDALVLAVWLRGSGVYDAGRQRSSSYGGRWRVVLTTEDTAFQESRVGPVDVRPSIESEDPLRIAFRRPSAVMARRR
ncbi:MAG: malto-oligosyltrehalose trehalohydrolase [Acidobacteria bacterium]|nr:malto-oligosyltrehalose trehalohydrolase [Acidobacteriota bacterium]